MKNIRNFCIIAHIDHGKSTLADRFLELTGTVEMRKMRQQYLDSMDLERERGITIKMQPVRMNYEIKGMNYQLNLIDTPGHIDFNYEVSRALAAVEGAVLLVDATQGIQAQTLTNLYLALEQGLEIISVINKVDLPNAEVEKTENEMLSLLGDVEISKISAKSGLGVEAVLERIVEKVPAPKNNQNNENESLRALIFDSHYDSYKGVIANIRVVSGSIRKNDRFLMLANKQNAEALEVGVMSPELKPIGELFAGEIGYIATGLKEVDQCRIGDTISKPVGSGVGLPDPLPGYREPRPMVFASIYPVNEEYDLLKDALMKLKLNDAALFFEPESSEALGRGFRCGFLGMLHLEIITERLKREYRLEIITTTPSVIYKIVNNRGEELNIYSPTELPEQNLLESISQPWVKLEIMTPVVFFGAIMKLMEQYHNRFLGNDFISSERVKLSFEIPLREVIIDFYDKLKSATSGYASLSYEIIGWQKDDLVKMDIMVGGEKVEAFSQIVFKDSAFYEGRAIVKKLKEVLPRQLFVIAIQASIGGRVIARETIKALRKDVTGYLYGGDVTRKKKLLEKQKKGKKKMKAIGRVSIPSKVYLDILKR